jgi:hypothetical protein
VAFLVNFSRFGMWHQEKSGNTVLNVLGACGNAANYSSTVKNVPPKWLNLSWCAFAQLTHEVRAARYLPKNIPNLVNFERPWLGKFLGYGERKICGLGFK